jgi:hypothetical protein
MPEADELDLVWIRQRLDQHTVNDAEDRRRGTDAERQCERSSNREARMAPKSTKGTTKVSCEHFTQSDRSVLQCLQSS